MGGVAQPRHFFGGFEEEDLRGSKMQIPGEAQKVEGWIFVNPGELCESHHYEIVLASYSKESFLKRGKGGSYIKYPLSWAFGKTRINEESRNTSLPLKVF
jgi:hypothetical protein